jgi:hypothetical protein
LAVEQQQGAGDAVGEVEGLVVQEPADLGLAFVAGGGAGVAAGVGDRDRAGVYGASGRLQEVPHPVAGWRGVGQVGVDVGLPQVGQCAVPVGEPVQQVDRGVDVDAGVVVVGAGPVGVRGGGRSRRRTCQVA